MRCLFKVFLGGVAAAALLLYVWLGSHGVSSNSSSRRIGSGSRATSAEPIDGRTWGNSASLPDHFARHGSDFNARSADDYARMAAQFLQRAKAEGLPAKVDEYGVLRIYDPRSGTFGAYNRNGTTKTFFKPGSPGYFDRQPGRPINLKTGR